MRDQNWNVKGNCYTTFSINHDDLCIEYCYSTVIDPISFLREYNFISPLILQNLNLEWIL